MERKPVISKSRLLSNESFSLQSLIYKRTCINTGKTGASCLHDVEYESHRQLNPTQIIQVRIINFPGPMTLKTTRLFQ